MNVQIKAVLRQFIGQTLFPLAGQVLHALSGKEAADGYKIFKIK